jgi:hypothetical protein
MGQLGDSVSTATSLVVLRFIKYGSRPTVNKVVNCAWILYNWIQSKAGLVKRRLVAFPVQPLAIGRVHGAPHTKIEACQVLLWQAEREGKARSARGERYSHVQGLAEPHPSLAKRAKVGSGLGK